MITSDVLHSVEHRKSQKSATCIDVETKFDNKDVEKSVAFYAKAFGCEIRRLDKSRRWGELQSGNTTLAFTPVKQRETEELTGKVHIPQHERNHIEVCFDYSDVDSAFKRAVENGAMAVSEPEEKEWGQKVGYVRDIDGNVVRIGSHVRQ